jgi:hypothetical protein
MPGGINKIKVGSRPTTDAPLTGAHLAQPDLNVVARPTDPYIQTFKDADTNNIFGQLQGLVTSSAPLAAAGAQEAQAQGAREWNPSVPTGPTSDFGGEGPVVADQQTTTTRDKPQGLLGRVFTQAYQAGYDKIDGEHKASLYYNEAYQYAQDNKLKPVEEVRRGLDALRQKYTGSMVSNVQLDAWLPKAAAVEEKLIHDHVIEGVKLQHDEATANLNGVLRDRAVSNILMPTFATVGINSLEELKTDAGIAKLQDNIATIGPALRTQLRSFLTSAQTEYAGTHSKAEISDMVSNLMIGLAKDTVTPELLDFAKEPESSAPGAVTLRDRNDPAGNNLGARIDNADKQIEQQRHTMMVQRREEKHRLQMENNQKEMVLFAITAGNLYKLPPREFPAALAQMEQMKNDILLTHPGMTVAQYVEMGQIYNSVAKRTTHPVQTDARAEFDFWTKFGHGEMTPGYVAQNAHLYSEQDTSNYYSLAGHQEQMRSEKDKAKKDAYFSDREMNKLAYDELEKSVNPKDSTGTYFLDPAGATNAIEARDLLAKKSNQWSRTHNDTAPDKDTLEKIVAEVHSKYPPFKAPTPEQWSAAVKSLETDPLGMPKTWTEYESRYVKMNTIQRYVAAAVLSKKEPPKPPVQRRY